MLIRQKRHEHLIELTWLALKLSGLLFPICSYCLSPESGGLVSGDPSGFPILIGLFLEILYCRPPLTSYGTFPFSRHVMEHPEP